LIFEDNTLASIASEFNRYNPKLKIRVVGDIAATQRFSGTFNADAPEAIMQALNDVPTLRVDHLGREIVIQPRISLQSFTSKRESTASTAIHQSSVTH